MYTTTMKMNIIISFLDFFKGIVSKILRMFSQLKNNVTEDATALLVVIAFIGWISFSNYKEKQASESN
jgi:hypothetical protein